MCHIIFFHVVLNFGYEKRKKHYTLSLFSCVRFVIKIERVHCYWVGFYFNIFTLYDSVSFYLSLSRSCPDLLFWQWFALNLYHVKGVDFGSQLTLVLTRLAILLNVYLFVCCCRLPMRWVGERTREIESVRVQILWTYGVKMYFKRFHVA